MKNPQYQPKQCKLDRWRMNRLDLIRSHIAASLIGQAVDLLVGAGKTAHGVVSDVQIERGAPKLVVSGLKYDLDQVLTVTPATLN